MRLSKILCHIILSLGAIAAAPAYAQPLADVLADLPTLNPALKSAQSTLEAERERLNQARAAFLPTLNFNADASIQSSQAEAGFSFGADDNVRNANLTLTQPLYAGGRDKAGLARVKANITAAEASYHTTLQTQKLATITSYLNLLTAQTRKQQTTQFVKTLTEAQAAEQARFESGESARTDVMQATAVLEQGKADNALATASIAEFKTELTAQRGGKALTSTLSWPQLPEIPQDITALEELLPNHPRNIAARAATTAAQTQIKSARGLFLPTLNLEATANDTTRSFSPNTQTLGLNLSVPLFAGGGNLSQYRQAQFLATAAADDAHSIAQNVRQQALVAFHNVQASAANLKALNAASAAQKEATQGTKARYTEGESTLLDALEAEQDLLAAQTAAIQAEQQHLLNAFTLQAALGTLE